MAEYRFNHCIENIRMSPIVAISEEVRKKGVEFKEKTGKDIIPFQRGEIDFATPEYIREAAKKAMDGGLTKYPRSGGEKRFKEAVINKLARYNKVTGIDEDNIVATYGGQEALELIFQLFHGKKVGGFAPAWSCVLENFVPYANVEFTEVPLEKDFSVNYDRLREVLKDVSLFYLNTPQNPTGKLFTKEEVTKIADMCLEYNVYLLTDEAYERIVFDGNSHFSPLSLEYDNIIGAFTLSKTYSMTGWRVGYLVTRDKEIARLMRLGNYTQTAGVTTFLQYAAAEALDNVEEDNKAVGAMIEEFRKRRNALYDGFKEIPGINFDKPDGAFYLFPNFSAHIPESVQGVERNTYIYKKLLEEGVAAVYGSCFGNHFVDNVRFSFSGVTIAQINEGIERMKKIFR